jgi:hypothetical protein
MKHHRTWLIGFISCGAVEVAFAQAPFAPFPAPIAGLSGNVNNLATVDMNGDGHPDLVSTSGAKLRIELNRGDGSLGFPSITELRYGDYKTAFGDFNEDGHMDVVCVNRSATQGLSIRLALGDGLGGVALKSVPFIGSVFVLHVEVVDVNNDDHLDLAIMGGPPNNGFTTLLGDGSGGFTETSLYSQVGRPFHFGDFDHDGWIDVVGPGLQPPYGIVIGKGDGSGYFPTVTQLLPGINTRGMAVHDTDGDGWLDIFACDDSALLYELRGTGPNSFSTPITHDAGAPVASPVLGDVDLDGAVDLVAVNPYSYDRAIVFRGMHAGSLSAPTTVPWRMIGPSIVDFDGDGRIDLVSGTGEVLRGDGLGGFVLPTMWSAGTGANTLIPVDLDGDGDLDIATPGFQSWGSMLLNDGLGNLSIAELQSISGHDATFGDFNGDGILDVATVWPDRLRVQFGTGLPYPIFQGAPVQDTPGSGEAIEHGDIDGDGDLDLLIRTSNAAIIVYVNDGAGAFSLAASLPNAREMRVADMNGDGIADLITRNPSPERVEIRLSSAGGGFQPPSSFALPGPGGDLIVVDIDGDGHLDVIAGSGSFPTPTISVCRGDGNGSLLARVDTAPPLLGSASSSPVAAQWMGDTDGNGRLEILASGGAHLEYNAATGGFGLIGRLAIGGSLHAFADLDGDGRDEVVSLRQSPAPSKLLVHTRRTPIALRAYCTASVSALGCSPTITSSGSPSISNATDFTVRVGGADGQRAGLLFYGISGRAEVPWAGTTGYLCVKAPTQRTELQFSGGAAGQCDGALSLDLHAWLSAHPGALGQPVAVGQTFNLQAWLRDPASPKTTAPSNALELRWSP